MMIHKYTHWKSGTKRHDLCMPLQNHPSATLGAITLEPYIGCPYPWVLGGHEWVWVRYYCSWVGIGFVHPCIQLQIRVKLPGCKEYANQEALRVEVKTVNDLLFIRSNQNLV